MSRLHAAGGEGPWADVATLPEGTDYAKLARLWKRQGHLTAEPQSTQRTTTAGSLVTTTARLSLPNPHPLLSSSATLRVLCGKKLRCLEEKALRLLHWGLTSEKRSERRLARQIMRKWLRVDECGEVVFWKRPPKRRRTGRTRRTGPKPDRRAERRRRRRAAARRRAQNFLADLGAPLILKPIPARMRSDRGGGRSGLAQRQGQRPCPI